MKASFTAVTRKATAMLMALSALCSVSAAERLDDWSSPRPVKYDARAVDPASVAGGQTAGGQTSVGQTSDGHAAASAPVSYPDRAGVSVPSYNNASRAGLPTPTNQLQISQSHATETYPSENHPTQGRGLFPVPQLMKPEDVAASMQYATHEVPVPEYHAAPSENALSTPLMETPAITSSGYGTSVLVASSDDRVRSDTVASGRVYQDPPSMHSTAPPQRRRYPARPAPVQQPKLPPPHIATTTVSGWQLGRLAAQKLDEAHAMLQRRSPMSARQMALEAMHLMAQSADEVDGNSASSDALSHGLDAMREATDFLGRFGAVDHEALQRLVDAHQTPVLKRVDLQSISPLRAADTYYEFARSCFVKSVGRWPNAADALLILAKTQPHVIDDSDTNLSAGEICYLRAAVACDPRNSLAANELGHELLALGMFDEARWALEHSYAQQPSAAALQNLAELHRVTGNLQLAQACTANLASIEQQQPRRATVVQLPPEQFAQLSPQVMEPTMVAMQPQSMGQSIPTNQGIPAGANPSGVRAMYPEQSIQQTSARTGQSDTAAPSAMDRVKQIFK